MYCCLGEGLNHDLKRKDDRCDSPSFAVILLPVLKGRGWGKVRGGVMVVSPFEPSQY